MTGMQGACVRSIQIGRVQPLMVGGRKMMAKPHNRGRCLLAHSVWQAMSKRI